MPPQYIQRVTAEHSSAPWDLLQVRHLVFFPSVAVVVGERSAERLDDWDLVFRWMWEWGNVGALMMREVHAGG